MGYSDDDNIVWGTSLDDGDDNIVRGTLCSWTATYGAITCRDEGTSMLNLPYRPGLDMVMPPPACGARHRSPPVVQTDWRQQLPLLRGQKVTLRELRTSDAASLFALLTAARSGAVHLAAADDGRRLRALHRLDAARERTAGCYVCFAVTLQGSDTAIGIFQVRQLERGFETAEWGFAIGSPFWGTGVFQEGAALVLDFIFNTLGTHRLEARAAAENGRGNGALRQAGRRPGSAAAAIVPAQQNVSRSGACGRSSRRTGAQGGKQLERTHSVGLYCASTASTGTFDQVPHLVGGGAANEIGQEAVAVRGLWRSGRRSGIQQFSPAPSPDRPWRAPPWTVKPCDDSCARSDSR